MSVIFRFKVSIQDKGRDRQVHVEKNSFIIGRGKDADIMIPDDLISREQLRITHSLGNIWMEELGSSNGTWLDGKKIPANHKMIYRPGQILALGGKSGPLLALECTVIEDVVQGQKPMDEQIWAQEKKVVNGSAPMPAQVKRSVPTPALHVETPAVAPTPAREKLAIVSKKVEAAAPEERITSIKSQAEQNLFEHIRNLVGSEAEAIRDACVEEAKRVKKTAEEFASQHIQTARAEAVQTMNEAEAHANKKMSELKSFESDANRRLSEAQNERQAILAELSQLKESESSYRETLEQLQQTIQHEEKRIQFEIEKLKEDKNHFEQESRNLDERINNAAADERKLKADLQAEMSEVLFQINQLKVEIEQAEELKERLNPEVNELESDKEKLRTQISSLKADYEREEGLLKILARDYDEAQKGLERSRIEFEVTTQNLEIQRKEIHKTRDEVTTLHKLASEVLEQAKLQSQAMLEEVTLRSEVMVRDAQEKVQSLNEQKERLQSDIDLERAQKLSLVQDELDRAKLENDKSVQKLNEKKSKLIKDLEKMAVSGHEEFHKIINQAKADAQEIKQNSLSEASLLQQTSAAESKRLRNEAEKALEKAELIAAARLEQAKIEVQAEKDRVKHELTQLEMRKHSMEEDVLEARRKREDLLDGARDKVREALAQAENDALILKKQIFDAGKVEAKELLVQAESLAKEEKSKLVIQLAEMKHLESARIKEMRAQSEEDWNQRRTERAKTVSTNLYALLATEMYKFRNKPMDDAFIETFSKEFKELVVDTMLDRVGPDTSKLQSILKTGADAKNKEFRFWRKVKIGGFSAAALLAILIFFPQVVTIPKDKIVSAFTDKKDNNSSDVFLKKIQDARVKAVYAPTSTAEYKSSYVENVLYTTDFITKVQDQSFQDKWILDLNDWFIRSLDVKDTTIIKFVSLENNLLRDLAKIKAGIDPANIAPGIEQMNNREVEFRQKLSDIFGDPTKVERYYEFSAKFWNEFYNPRKPAAN